jgi:hypothetical protein
MMHATWPEIAVLISGGMVIGILGVTLIEWLVDRRNDGND